MASVNKIILLGNVGRDPEVRYTAGGMAVASFSLATSKRRKDRDSGETTEETQWHRITCWDRPAEIAGEYVRKGSSIYVEGEIRYGKYTDKDGVERNTCDIHVASLQLLGGRRDDGEGQGAPQQRQAPAQRPQAQPQQRQQAPARQPSGGFEDMDDDIPFRDVLARRGVHLVF